MVRAQIHIELVDKMTPVNERMIASQFNNRLFHSIGYDERRRDNDNENTTYETQDNNGQ